MRALLVDDERLARAELRRLLAGHADIEIAGEAATVAEAEKLALELKPELIFLDIEMPGGDGFELVERLEVASDRLPAIVFTTAFDQYAVRAFEVQAMDYLLKPVTAERLAKALAGIREAAATSLPGKQAEKQESGSLPLEQFFVRDGERCWVVRTPELRLIESEGNYARLHFGKNRPLILRSLQTLQQRLDPAMFFRANRTQIVNLRWIERMELNPDNSLSAILKDASRVDLSRRQSQVFRETLSL